MQKITFRKLVEKNIFTRNCRDTLSSFLVPVFMMESGLVRIRKFRIIMESDKDLVDAFQKLHPPVIRWPGGCYADVYHWRNGIGPREQRPVTYNENFGTFRDRSESVRYTRDDGILRDDRREAMV